jgi:hypothetical protein
MEEGEGREDGQGDGREEAAMLLVRGERGSEKELFVVGEGKIREGAKKNDKDTNSNEG